MSADVIMPLVATLGFLVLALSTLRAQRIPTHRALRFALIWGVIIVGLVILLRAFGWG